MSRSSRVPRGVLVLTMATFVALALAAVLTDGIAADATIRAHVLAAAAPSVVSAMRVVNVAGDWKVLLPATLLLLLVFDRARRTWWAWIALMVAAPLIEGTLKITVARPRPEGTAYGFPSGHATAVAAYAGALLYLASELPPRWKTTLRCFAIALMLAVGIARVVLRAHWPSDVVAGFALGLALASVATLVATAATPTARAS
jgi:undecaprenyl-diphosphatase